MLTGNPDATDPVCPKSPDHHLVTAALAEAERQDIVHPLVFRDPKESRRLARPF